MASEAHPAPLHIFRLPDETLLKIFRYVKGQDSDSIVVPEQESTYEIKKIRSLCRRFSNIASELLVRLVRVDLSDPTTLSRLERISHHPGIRKGVRVIIIDVCYYNTTLAEDNWATFADYIAANMSRLASRFSYTTLAHKPDHISYLALRASEFANGIQAHPPRTQQHIKDRDLLFDAFDIYKQLYTKQKRMLEDGSFIRAIVSSVSRFPHVQHLAIGDSIRRNGREVELGLSSEHIFDESQILIEMMTLPMQWNKARTAGLVPGPVDLLVKLPIAMYAAGVSLKYLTLNFTSPGDFSTLEASKEELCSLTSALQKMQVFRFCPGNEYFNGQWYVAPQPIGSDKLGRYLSAVLNTDSLVSVELIFGGIWNLNRLAPPKYDLESFVPIRTWKNLLHLTLDSLPFHLSALQRLFEAQTQPRVETHLHSCYMYNGRWADVLDLLRERSTDTSSFRDPMGGGLEDMDDEDQIGIFSAQGKGASKPSQAEQFIQGSVDENPLRKPHLFHLY